MPTSWARLADSLPFSRIFRQLEQEMETVVRVLQPGPLGIIEHKFSADEIHGANAAVRKAVEKWQRHSDIEQNGDIFKNYTTKK